MKTEAAEPLYLIHPVHLLPVRNMKGKVPADMCAPQILGSHEQFTVQCPFSLQISQTLHQQAILKSAKCRSQLQAKQCSVSAQT